MVRLSRWEGAEVSWVVGKGKGYTVRMSLKRATGISWVRVGGERQGYNEHK
jgi:hypothetical protein